MSLAYVRTTPRVGMGFTVPSFTDTGDGITPQNFQANCCSGSSFISVDSCDAWLQANQSIFGGDRFSTPCDAAAIANLTGPPVVGTMASPAPPPIVTAGGSTAANPLYGQALVPVVTCPASSPCPQCNGRLVASPQDGVDLQTCQAIQQAQIQAAAVAASMSANASAQCVQQKVTCAQNWLQTLPTSDCTGCQIDLTSPGLWLGIAAVGAVLFLAARLLP